MQWRRAAIIRDDYLFASVLVGALLHETISGGSLRKINRSFGVAMGYKKWEIPTDEDSYG
jgi:hypothetical protein